MSFEVQTFAELSSDAKQAFLFQGLRQDSAERLGSLGILQKAETAREFKRQETEELKRRLLIREIQSTKALKYILTFAGVALVTPVGGIEREEELVEVTAIQFTDVFINKHGQYKPQKESIPMFTFDNYGDRTPTYDFTDDDIKAVNEEINKFTLAAELGFLPDLSNDYTRINTNKKAHNQHP